jgi:hypothetical protein
MVSTAAKIVIKLSLVVEHLRANWLKVFSILHASINSIG